MHVASYIDAYAGIVSFVILGIVTAWMRHLACVPSFIFGVEDSVDFRQKAVLLWRRALR